METISIDENWTVRYDPSDLNRPKYVFYQGEFRGELRGPLIITAMFKALIKAVDAPFSEDA